LHAFENPGNPELSAHIYDRQADRVRLRRTGTTHNYAQRIFLTAHVLVENAVPDKHEERWREERRLENIWGAITLATVDKMEQAFAAETGRGPSAVAAITQIGIEPGLSIERLRRIVALSHSATVRLVDQLAAEGLVRRETSSGTDKRARSLYLTDEGEALFEKAKAARRRVAEAALDRLSGKERQNLITIIEKMFPALVGPGDDELVVCRFCEDGSVCPPDRCPVPHSEA
jgi:DNA-binding MarR family transcriptional regulator